ncbi:YfiT family bacillithiol transferase [Leadbetterella byssophila]|uniref:YfiT family bacillithiol transferase n=1 Tax=Leadbetterella byssophila TaxID=316068 RepID=UPI0039A266EE
MENLKYPIGPFDFERPYKVSDAAEAVAHLKSFPGQLIARVKDLTDEQLALTYRPGGWSVRQILHHYPDSHLNLYTRLKFALTEDKPSIKGYNEALWATTPDYKGDIALPLSFLKAIHGKLVAIMEDMTEEQWMRTYFHMEYQKTFVLKDVVQLYKWHCDHHLAHIELALSTSK